MYQKIRRGLEFDSNFKIMSIILACDETGGQEDGPKCPDDLSILMSNARSLETPKKKKETTGNIVKIRCILYTFFVKSPSTKSFLFGFLNVY